jgi:hypothetical protein
MRAHYRSRQSPPMLLHGVTIRSPRTLQIPSPEFRKSAPGLLLLSAARGMHQSSRSGVPETDHNPCILISYRRMERSQY